MLRRQKHALLQSTTPFACTLDSIATSIARYEEYRCWASKCGRVGQEFRDLPNMLSDNFLVL